MSLSAEEMDGMSEDDWEKYVSEKMDREYFGRGQSYDGELDDLEFADPGGTSALRAAGPGNPRNLPCPDCGSPNRLTPKDRDLGYCCDSCADRKERGYDY